MTISLKQADLAMGWLTYLKIKLTTKQKDTKYSQKNKHKETQMLKKKKKGKVKRRREQRTTKSIGKQSLKYQ